VVKKRIFDIFDSAGYKICDMSEKNLVLHFMYFAISKLFFFDTNSLKRHLGPLLVKKPVFWSLLTFFDQFQSRISLSFCDVEKSQYTFWKEKYLTFKKLKFILTLSYTFFTPGLL
jgi:hypothetical protein